MAKSKTQAPFRRIKSIDLVEHTDGLAAFEADTRFVKERLAEGTLRVCGALAILVGYFHWYLPGSIYPVANNLHTQLLVTALLVGGGVGLYLFAGRGFQKLLQLHLHSGDITLEQLNGHARSLWQKKYRIADVDSAYVRRGKTAGAPAGFYLCLRGVPDHILALEGEREELEELHRLFSAAIADRVRRLPKRVRRIPVGNARPQRPYVMAASR